LKEVGTTLVKLFLREQKETLKTLGTENVDWFLPKCYGGLGIPERKSYIAKHALDENLVLASYLHQQMLGGCMPRSPFGRWTQDMHPWLKRALQETEKYETKSVQFLDVLPELDPYMPTSWADIVDEAEEDAWGIQRRCDLFTPVLWDFAASSTFNNVDDMLPGKERKGKEKNNYKKEIRKNKQLQERVYACLRPRRRLYAKANQWGKKQQSKVGTNHPFTVEDFFRPRKICTETNNQSLAILDQLAVGPRNLIRSLPDPTQWGDFTVTSKHLAVLFPSPNL
jgi:hypothetical protein